MGLGTLALSDACHLRLLESADADELYALIDANRAHLARWMPWPGEQTLDATRSFIALTRQQLADDNGLQTAIVRDRSIVGVVGFHAVAWPHRSTSIGYWLAEPEQGRGTMTLAVRALVDHALGTWRLNRVEIRAAATNARSRAIPERLGFRHEGTLRQAERIGERFVDHAVYSMLAADWPGGD